MTHNPDSSITPPSSYPRPRFRRNFQIAVICALPLEYDAAALLVDEFWDLNDSQYGRADGDKNTYRNGRIGQHNVVLMLLPAMGTAAVAGSAASLRTSYPALQIAFLVGICGGSPSIQPAFLGDVVISDGVLQYRLGRQYPGGFVMKGMSEGNVHAPNKEIRGLIAYFKTEAGIRELEDGSAHHLKVLQDESVRRNYKTSYQYPGFVEDKLFESAYSHKHRDLSLCKLCFRDADLCEMATQQPCSELDCDESKLVPRAQLGSVEGQRLAQAKARGPAIFIGRVASGDTVMKSGEHRDKIAKEHSIIAFEMEGAGLWDEIPTVVIKGICDYSDSHKNKLWQPYAAATAASVTKAVIQRYSLNDNIETSLIPLAQENKQSHPKTRSLVLVKDKFSFKKSKIRATDPLWTLENSILNFQLSLDEPWRTELLEIQAVPGPDEVLIFTAYLDSQNRNRKGQSISSRFYSVLQSARDFSETVDDFNSSHSNLPFLIWGSVKLTVLIAYKSAAYYETFSEIFLKIARICPSLQQYSKLYGTSLTLRRSLCDFYASLIEFCKRVIEISTKAPQGFSFWSPPEVALRGLTPSIKDMERLNANLQQRFLAAIEEDSNSDPSGCEDNLSNQQYSKGIFKWSSSKSEEARVSKRRRKEETQELLDSLSSHNFLKPLKQSRGKRQNGTGEWLFETQELIQWIDGNGAPALWCSGKIGSGKTILTSSIVDKILTEKRSPNTFLSFFFVQFDNHASLQSATILKSIIRQALSQAGIPEEGKPLIEQIQRDMDSTPQTLVHILLTIAARCTKLYIVIDGLDECERPDCDEVLEALSSLVARARPLSVLIFISSRDSIKDQMKRAFVEGFDRLSTETPAAESEIAIYVNAMIDEKLRKENLNVGDPKLIEEIKAALTDGAHGMFLWATFQIDELCSRRCDDEIRKAIKDLPKDLTETFNRALHRILFQHHGDIAQRCFQWVAAAQRPLTRDELREAISIEINQPHSMGERLTNGIHLISSWCENLLVCDEEEYIVQFAHHSVRKFLTEAQYPTRHPKLDVFHFNLQNADHFVGEICVSYLNFDDFKTSLARVQQPQQPEPQKRSLPRVLPSDIAWKTLGHAWSSGGSMHALRRLVSGSEIKHSVLDVIENLASFHEDPITPTGTQNYHPFLNYASTHWLQHSKSFQVGLSKTWDIWQKMVAYGHIMAKFPWEPAILKHHFLRFQPEHIYDQNTHLHGIGRAPPYHPLTWAFNHRHRALVWLIFQTIPISQMVFYHHIVALIARSIAEQDIQLLDAILSHNNFKVVLDSSGFDGGTALCAAASAGYLEVIISLLVAGADVNLPREVSGTKTALHLAAESGYSDVTARLVAVGADLDKHVEFEGDYFTALHFAAKAGHQEVVEILLRAGAHVDVRMSGRGKLTPFHLAVGSGHSEITARLIAAGADVDEIVEIGGKRFNALGLATEKGHREIIQVLLASGAGSSMYRKRRWSIDAVFNSLEYLSENED